MAASAPGRFPARVHVLLASRAPYGVIIRRGPAKAVCTVGWDRSQDTFQVGQWLKGRIYERRSDLSPDGRYLIYFAMNGKWDSETRGSWTAISRAPYLKAIALFGKGDCWHGGGLFTGRAREPRGLRRLAPALCPGGDYWINDGCGHFELQNTAELRRALWYEPTGGVGGECLSVYYPRLLRDGWRRVVLTLAEPYRSHEVFEKDAGSGWMLRKLAHAQVNAPPGKGCYWDEHELVHPRTGVTLPFPTWEWADLDGRRLVYAAGGKLFAARLSAGGPTGETLLRDFNGMTFEPLSAPY